MKTQSKFSLLSLLIFFALISMNNSCFQSKEPEPAIEYPETGIAGQNILKLNTNGNTEAILPNSGFIYTISAKIPESKSLRIIIKNKSVNLPKQFIKEEDLANFSKWNLWWLNQGANFGWILQAYNYQTQSQELIANGQVVAEFPIKFGGEADKGNALIEIYENGSTEPTRTKTIQW